jgi:hypothetical protein
MGMAVDEDGRVTDVRMTDGRVGSAADAVPMVFQNHVTTEEIEIPYHKGDSILRWSW